MNNSHINPSPFWSVMIPVRNRTDFLSEAIESVLANGIDITSMQIEVIDNSTIDCNIYSIIDRLGHGRIRYYKQSKDLNMAENWNSCIERAQGKYVHILHDDDYIAPNFYITFREVINSNPGYGLYYCNSTMVNEKREVLGKNRVKDILYGDMHSLKKVQSYFINFPSVVVSRECYCQLGGFNPNYIYILDQEMWFRIARQFGSIGIDQYLAFYRISKSNASNELWASGKNISDEKRFYLSLRNFGFNFSDREVKEAINSKLYEQYLFFKAQRNRSSAKCFYRSLKDSTSWRERMGLIVHHYYTESRFFYFLRRIIFYLIYPWKIYKYIKHRLC